MRTNSVFFSWGVPEMTRNYMLLDGEMIIDADENTQKQERRCLIDGNYKKDCFKSFILNIFNFIC